MADPVVHRTFSVERTYPVPPPRVFAAFADPQTKRRWFVEGEGWEVDEFTLDFRVGGFERSRFRFAGRAATPSPPMRNDTVYLDIVPDERIVFAYTLTTDGICISAALATVEPNAAGGGTRLRLTEQAAFLHGTDASVSRQRGWGALLDALRETLRSRSGEAE